MPENIKNDWLVATASKPEFSLGDFEQVGLTPQNTQLLNAKDYEKNESVQKMFTDQQTGKFDKDRFKQFYDVATQTYNDFAKKEYDSTMLNDNYFFQENFHAPKDAKRFKTTVNISKVKNPFNQKQGIEGFTTKTDSGLSVREIAQTQKIKDHTTGKDLDYTPNQSGFFGSLFKPTAVMAMWDTDGEHYDEDLGKKVKHSAGEFKYNEDGKNYYETLGSREVYGKEALSSWDVLTEDGSSANKWDFMDGDSLTKSLTGTIFKTVAQVLPHLIPGVGQWYTGITVGSALLTDLLPTLGKATGGLFLGDALHDSDFFKSMNQLQGFGKRFQTSISDEGKQSTFNKENLFAMAGDVFGQLAQQQAIAKIPLWLGQTGKEMKVFEKYAAKYGEEGLEDIRKTLKTFKGENAMGLRANYLRNELGADNDLLQVMNNWDKWGSTGAKALGISYMSGISATGVAEEAKLHGLDERDTSMMFLGTMAGFGAMMTKLEFAHWAIKGIGLDELGGFLKKAVKEEVKLTAGTIDKIANSIGDDVIAAGTKAGDNVAATIAEGGAEATKNSARARLISMFNKGKEIAKKISNSLDDTDVIKSKILAEALEETTEEAMQDALKGMYNGMRALGLTSTDKEKSKAFSFEDITSRYLMSALGGAMGGGIAAVQQKMAGKIYDELPESLTKDFASIARHGYADTTQKVLDKMRDQGKFGSSTLSIKQFVPTPGEELSKEMNYVPMSADADGMSHNDFIYNVLSAQLKLAQNAIVQEGIDGDVRLNDIYAERANMFMDIKNNTAIVDDIDNITAQIIKLKAKQAEEEGGTKEGTKGENAMLASSGSSTKKQIADLKEQLLEITSGKRAVQYVGEALFGMNRQLNEAFGIENKDTIAMTDFQKKFDDLDANDKAKVEEKYADYKAKDKRQQVRMRKGEFDELKNGEFNNILPELQTYGLQRKEFLHNFTDIPNAITKIELGKQEYQKLTEQQQQAIKTILDSDTTTLDRLTVNNEEDVDKIDNNNLGSLNIGNIQNSGQASTPLQILANYVRGEKYLNPAMNDFIKNNYDTTLKMEEGFNDAYSDILKQQNIDSFNVNLQNIAAETGVPVDRIIKNLSPYNFTESFETLRDVVNNPRFKNLALFNYDDSGSPINEKVLKDAYLQAVDLIESTQLNDIVDNGDGTATLSPKPNAAEDIAAIDYIKGEYEKRPNNPLFDYIASLTEREGRNDLANLINIINSEFNNLGKKDVANDYVIDNKISKDQLLYGKHLLERVNAIMQASIDYTGFAPDTEGIGFNAAMNAIAKKNKTEGFEPLNVLTAEASSAISADLQWLAAKIDFLLNLSEFNTNGSIREMKLTGATMSTLFLSSLEQGKDAHTALERAGIDMAAINTAIDTATQFKKNMESINSPEDAKIPMQSTDEAFHKIRIERDRVEQAIFEVVNAREDRVEIINKVLDFYKVGVYTVDNNAVDFKSTLRVLPKGQELIYLAQTLTVDPKQFYKDFVGDLANGENFLETDPYAPFYGQEHVIKQMYWHAISKMSPVDTHRKVADILLLPDTKLTDVETYDIETSLAGGIKAVDLQNLNRFKNVTTLYGMPGAGKTTSALYYITKIAERYKMDVAVFAPHKEQGENLKESLKDRPNVYNNSKTVSSLLDSILGTPLTDKIREDYASKNFVVYDVTKDISTVDSKSTLMLKQSGSAQTIVLNPNNPAVADFLKDDSKIISFEGKVPRLIVIDEATHIPTVEISILNKAIETHNKNSKDQPISLFLVGDREQRGNNIKVGGNVMADNITASTLMIKTPVLSQSIRNRFNIKNKNLNSVRALRKMFEEATGGQRPNLAGGTKLLNEGITFEYENNPLYGLVGEKLVTEFSREDIELLFSNPTDKVALISDKASESLISMIKTIPGAFERLSVITPDKVQGLEFDSVIIDVKPDDKRPATIEEVNESYSAMEMLYTMVSRSKKGSLIKAPFIRSIALKSTDQDVHAQNVQLDKAQIEKYKTFTLKGISDSFSGLADLNLAGVKPEIKPDKIEVEPATENTEEFFMNLYEELMKTKSDDPQDIQTGSGDIVQEPDIQTPLTYTFHERLGFKVGSDGRPEGPFDDSKDAAAIYKILTGKSVDTDLKMSDAIMNVTRAQLEALKSGIINYAKISGTYAGDLNSFLRTQYKVDIKIANSFDFTKAVYKVVTKEFDAKSDFSFKHRDLQAKSKGGGLISYLVMQVPNYNGGTTDITITAFPNINNPKVAAMKGVMASMAKIKELHQTNAVAGVSEIQIDPNKKLADLFTPTANLSVRREDQVPARPYKIFKQEHSHLNMSVPYIFLNSDIMNGEDPNVVREYFANFQRGGVKADKTVNKGSSQLIGKPVIFVSYDKTIPRNELPNRYRSQLQQQLTQRVAGEPVDPGTIRMVPLNKKGLPFKQWLKKNVAITKAQSSTDIDLKAQRRAYGNGFAAASLLANLINFKRRAQYFKANPEQGKTIAQSLELNTMPVGQVELLIQQVDKIVRTAVPMTTGKTFEDVYVLGATSAEQALENYIKQSQSDIDEFLNTVYDGKSQNVRKATEHFIALDLLKQMKVRSTTDASLKKYTINGVDSSLNIPNSGLYDFISAIRLSMVGGRLTTNDGDTKDIDGILQSALVRGTKDEKAFDNLLDGIDAIIRPTFPDGMHINPVLRSVTQDNKYQGDAPFVVPAGNVDDDFMVTGDIQTPTIYFDLENMGIVQQAKPTQGASRQGEQTTEGLFLRSQEKLLEYTYHPQDGFVARSGGLLSAGIVDGLNQAYTYDDFVAKYPNKDIKAYFIDTMTKYQAAVNDVIGKMIDDVVSVSGVDFKIIGFDFESKAGLVTSGLVQEGKSFLEREVAGKPVDLSNVEVDYVSRNRPGTTEKVREFTVKDSVNGDIIATFVYANKQFSDFNLVAPVQIDITTLPSLFKGSPIEADFIELYDVITTGQGAPVDPKGQMAFGKKYAKSRKFLNDNGHTLESSMLSDAYAEYIKQTKC